ncbi:MAG TPA: glycosyltransferase [Alphaproteobacteria bacterium]|nr:glycosyltransferase [Alphaproteobacteria bacterium]
MRVVLFCHSLISDWNHGNAHFLRGIVRELRRRGHAVRVFEPDCSWSLGNLVADAGAAAIEDFKAAYPELTSTFYEPGTIDLDWALEGADVVIVHEWSDHKLVRRIGRHRRTNDYCLLFHDTHHRAMTDPESMAAYDLSEFDGVLAFGEALRRIYLERGWARAAWTWHEAADPTVFHPIEAPREGDLVWIGNWGDEERTQELREFLLDPVRELGLKASVYGVRYPQEALEALSDAGITYRGYLANARVPEVFARYGVTVHVPRRPYAQALPGIPTIRVFEALACGIPLISAPWDDVEHLFTPGRDFLVAPDGEAMRRQLRLVLADRDYAAALADRGRRAVLARHTCAHRVDELSAILQDGFGIDTSTEADACVAG